MIRKIISCAQIDHSLASSGLTALAATEEFLTHAAHASLPPHPFLCFSTESVAEFANFGGHLAPEMHHPFYCPDFQESSLIQL